MEFVILGLLAVRERTIYEIKKILEETVSLFYSASFGSINSAIEKMLSKGRVSVRESVENGRFKKIYAITPVGYAALQEWLGSKIPQERVKEPALTRLFFMGLLDSKKRIQVLADHLKTLQETLATLDAMEAETQKAEIPPEKRDLAAFQHLTLKYGRAYYAFNIQWYQNLLDELQTSHKETAR
ncbi:MAG: PadR family transcriptional regulator [Chloroflexota bacterium]